MKAQALAPLGGCGANFKPFVVFWIFLDFKSALVFCSFNLSEITTKCFVVFILLLLCFSITTKHE
jgi:hypothetical protein